MKATGVWVIALITALAAGSGCTKNRERLNPLDPQTILTPTPTPGPQILWKNGSAGSVLGKGMTIYASSPSSASTVSVTDNLTGDPSTLRLSASSLTNSARVSFGNFDSGCPNLSFFNNGRIKFNLRLELASASFVEILVGPSDYSIAPSGFSTSAFTAVDLPFTAFWPSGINDCFWGEFFSIECGLTSNVTGAIITINDVRWTKN